MVDFRTFNLSGTLSSLSLLFRPSQCIPQAVVRNFNELPIPLSRAFDNDKRFGKVNIRAVVLDKDDCFARPGENEIAPEFKVCDFISSCQYPLGATRCGTVVSFVTIFT
jgi:phosphatidylglycerophosphatase GEP4